MLDVRLILFPTDFSPNSQQAFDTACSLAKDYQAQLQILHVETDSAFSSIGGVPSELIEAQLEGVNEALLRYQLEAAPLCAETLLVCGINVADGIVAAARDEKADLIVMGAGSRSGLSRAIFAGVAEKVIRSAPCPVITVRPVLAPAHSTLLAEPEALCGAI